MSVQFSLRRSGLMLMAGALAVTLAACGSTATPAGDTTQAPNSTRPSRTGAPPGAFGTVAEVSGNAAQVQNPQNGQVTVNFDGSTTFTDSVAAALTDVTTGECVSVTGTAGSSADQLTAKAVTITKPGTNGCSAGGGDGTGGGGGASRTPNPSRQPRPSGSNAPNANGSRVFGTVSAVSATGFTTHGTNPSTKANVDTTVTVDSSTTFTKTVSATSAALVVGVCVAALGKADDTGAITAKSIAISKAGPNGCSGGFGRGGNRGGNG